MPIIITWFFFIISILLNVGVISLFYIFKDDQDIDAYYVFPLAFIFSGLIFYTAKDLFDIETAILIWKATAILNFVNLVIIFILFIRQINIHVFIIFAISLILAVIPFFIKSTNKSIDFSGLQTRDFIYIGIFVINAIVLSIYYITVRSKDRELYRSVQSFERSKFEHDLHRIDEKEMYRFNEFGEKSIRNISEEIFYNLRRFEERFEDLYRRQQSLFERAQSSNITNQEPAIENSKLLEIANTLNLIKSNFNNLNTTTEENVGVYSNSNNQNFIRELFHYLITPLSQIETKTIILSENPKLYEDTLQIEKISSTIKTCVEICKSVLAAYRELAFVTSSSDWSPESINQSIFAAGNLYKESIEKEVIINSLLPDQFIPYSNNYILALLLPLLENAVKASPPNKQINIYYVASESKINIFIENEAINMPTIQQLITPGFSSKRDHKGTGLLIARHLVEDQNKGSITFKIDTNFVITNVSIPKRSNNDR